MTLRSNYFFVYKVVEASCTPLEVWIFFLHCILLQAYKKKKKNPTKPLCMGMGKGNEIWKSLENKSQVIGLVKTKLYSLLNGVKFPSVTSPSSRCLAHLHSCALPKDLSNRSKATRSKRRLLLINGKSMTLGTKPLFI